jgi:hypothetical protein
MSRPCIPKNTADALRQQVYAARKRAEANALESSEPIQARWRRLEANDMEDYADNFLTLPGEPIEVGAAGEMLPTGERAFDRPDLIDTVCDPDGPRTLRAAACPTTTADGSDRSRCGATTRQKILARLRSNCRRISVSLPSKVVYFARVRNISRQTYTETWGRLSAGRLLLPLADDLPLGRSPRPSMSRTIPLLR